MSDQITPEQPKPQPPLEKRVLLLTPEKFGTSLIPRRQKLAELLNTGKSQTDPEVQSLSREIEIISQRAKLLDEDTKAPTLEDLRERQKSVGGEFAWLDQTKNYDYFLREGLNIRLKLLARRTEELKVKLSEDRTRSLLRKRMGRRALLAGAMAGMLGTAIALDRMRPQGLRSTPDPASSPTPDQTPSKTPVPSPTPEISTTPKTPEKLKTQCIGTLDLRSSASKNPEFYLPGTEKRISLAKIPEKFEIKGYGIGDKNSNSAYRYTIMDPSTGQLIEIPIRQVNIVEGSPIPESDIKPNPFFGIRVNDPESVKLACEMGVGKLRINGEGCEIDSPTQLKDRKLHNLIKEAIKYNMDIVLVFHPNTPLEKNELRRRIQCLLSNEQLGNYNKVSIELGNEPDDPNVDFWVDRNPQTFAKFIKDSTEIIREHPKGRDTKLILGAINTQPNTDKWFSTLMSSGVDLNDYEIALHIYNGVSNVSLRDWLRFLRDYLNKHNIKSAINITEFGVPNYDKRGFIEDLEFIKEQSKNLNISGVLIHELEDYEAQFGFVDPATRTPYPYFYGIQRATQLLV